jgi:hypothetical protein
MQMKLNFIKAILVLTSLSICGCGIAPIKAFHISDEKNIWIEDAESGLFYCVANQNGSKEVSPTCYAAARGAVKSFCLKPAGTIEPPLEFKKANEIVKEIKEPINPKESSDVKESIDVKEPTTLKESINIKETLVSP